MNHVLWASIATRAAMGQQQYESAIQQAILEQDAPNLIFNSVKVSSFRGSIPGVRHSSFRLYERASLPVALALGAMLYRTRGLVHRFDLRLPPHPGAEVITVHDLPPARFPDEGKLPRSMVAGARRARAVIVPSQFAAQEISELLGIHDAYVIPYGLSPLYLAPKPASDDTLRNLGIGTPFLIHAAGASDRKNLQALADAWRDLADDVDGLSLVLCGPPDQRRTDHFSGLPRVLMPGVLPPAVIASLMVRAEVVVVPSLYEGFGLPALEGMACGRPVVAAQAGALPEVCGDAALLVEPTSEGLAGGIRSGLFDRSLRHRLMLAGPRRARSFSWAAAARKHLDVYQAAI